MSVLAERPGEADFSAVAEPYRRELLAHCYRMTGSLHDAEDLVQETLLRAWKAYDRFEGKSSVRTWLHRIATNTCLTALEGRQRRPLPVGLGGPSSDPTAELVERREVPWLEPLPELTEHPADPSVVVGSRESVRLAFVAALQYLPPRQRAVLLLRDVLQWRSAEVADAVGTTTTAVNSLLQRARATLRQEAPDHRPAGVADPTGEERALVRRYMDAHERCDFAALAQLLRQDARLTMPPTPSWFQGRDAITALFASWLDPRSPAYVGEVRHLPISANRQLGSAGYLRQPGATAYRPLGLELLRIEQGQVSEITMFVTAELFSAFELPASL